MAQMIAELAGADLFEIIPEMLYPSGYQEVVDQAKEEIATGFRPGLKKDLESVNLYDIIFLGSPNWWGTIAPPVATFLSSHDLSGKTLVPFITHEGSGMGRAEENIKKLCPGAKLLQGMAVQGHHVTKARKEVRQWLQKIGIIQ
ncbi:MAG: hypothetical protein PWQ25_377 [Deferribacteres bacterium]|jgi:flavodoxin|nr:hypothetical protein [Deferribacteres bacterium]